jgi:predicted lipoprotein with Yx(FWY)xxD motif
MKNMKTILGLSLFILITGCSTVQSWTGQLMGSLPAKKNNGVLVNKAGMTLYTFDKDVAYSGKSVCNGQCALNWPPLRAGNDDKDYADFTVVSRDDATKQWAYKGKPLYHWSKDQKPGDMTGDKINGVWHIARD